MTDRDPDSDSPRSSGRSCAQGCLIAAGVCTVVIFVLAVVGFLFLAPRSAESLSASQPGGHITGHVVPAAALGEVRTVSLSHATPTLGGGYTSKSLDSVTLAPDGSFAFHAPALEGFYVVSAEGGTWMAEAESVSFVETDGTILSSVAVELELERGCLIEVRITRTTPGASTNGDVRYDLKYQGGMLFGALKGRQNGSRTIRGGRFEIGPLPPSTGQVTITLDDGATKTIDVEAKLGGQVLDVEL